MLHSRPSYSLILILTVLSFQNCSKVRFSKLAPAAEIVQASQAPPRDCQNLKSGETLFQQITDILEEPVACPYSGSKTARYHVEQKYICQDSFLSPLQEKRKGQYIDTIGTCSGPNLNAAFQNPNVDVGYANQLIWSSQNLSSLSFSCNNGESGSLALNGSRAVVANQDTKCTLVGRTVLGESILRDVEFQVFCGTGTYKVNGRCQAFSCQSYVDLAGGGLDIPARTSAGICYYKKIFNAIPYSASAGAFFSQVIAADHTMASLSAEPHIMGSSDLNVIMRGERKVKLSGSANTTSPILVDNFFLIDLGGPTKSFVYGTADSAYKNGNLITYNGVDLVVQSGGFAWGTATVNALDVSSGFQTLNQSFKFKAWALDCGAFAQVSDVYVVFE